MEGFDDVRFDHRWVSSSAICVRREASAASREQRLARARAASVRHEFLPPFGNFLALNLELLLLCRALSLSEDGRAAGESLFVDHRAAGLDDHLVVRLRLREGARALPPLQRQGRREPDPARALPASAATVGGEHRQAYG